MKIGKYKKLLLSALVVVIVIVAGYFVFSYYYNFTSAFAPPPASHVFLLDSGPSISSKLMCSRAAGFQNGNPGQFSCRDSRESLSGQPVAVTDNDVLEIRINYDPGSPNDNGDFPVVRRLIERLPTDNYFQYLSTDIGGNSINPDGYSPNDVVNSNLIYNNINQTFESPVQITIRLRALRISYPSSLTFEDGNSSLVVQYPGESNELLDLPDARVVIRNILGPVGDVYSESDINYGLGEENYGIDVLASGETVDPSYNFNSDNKPDWTLNNYDLKKENRKYWQYYKNKQNKYIKRIVNESAVTAHNPIELKNMLQNSDPEHKIILWNAPTGGPGGIDLGNLHINSNKVLITYQPINIVADIETTNDDSSFVIINWDSSNINIRAGATTVEAHIIGFNSLLRIYGTDYLILKGSINARKLWNVSNRRISYVYDSKIVQGLPGISSLINPLPLESF
jgi:hypothetical protein